MMKPLPTKPIKPLLIAVAPNGATKTKNDHLALPIGPSELAAEAALCVEAGASMIHLHVRDFKGGHTLDAGVYKTAIEAVRAEVGKNVIIQITSESVGIYRPEEQMEMVRVVRPEAVSLAIREICPSGFDEKVVANFLSWIAAERIMPQYIVFSAKELERLVSFHKRGIIPDERPFALFVLGRYTKEQQSSPLDLLSFLEVSKEVSIEWSMCAFGKEEARCALAAIVLDGHCRVGFENNIFLANGRIAPNNSALVTQVRDGAMMVNRPIADAMTARALLSRE